MRALVNARAEPGLWLEDVPEPEIGINDVLIRVQKNRGQGAQLHARRLGHPEEGSRRGLRERLDPSPALDRLATRSVVFDNHLTGSFPTIPARADLLTGRLSRTFMLWGRLSTALPTLPELLGQAGYRTMGIVDTPFNVRSGFGYDRGFQDFNWLRGQGDAKRKEERLDARSTWRRESDWWAAHTVTAAEEWLERHYMEHFFLLVAIWDPYEPGNPPDYYTRLYATTNSSQLGL